MNCTFILVEPAVPENIGAAARALKVMGFDDLRLVNPADHLSDPSRWLAHASGDVLESARVFSSLSYAIEDLDFIVGTTAKRRSVKYDYYRPEEIKDILGDKSGAVSEIGIVFGREESGLTNQELQLCDLLSTIPMATKYPSVNLAQSVMLYAYILSEVKWEDKKTDQKDVNLQQQLKNSVPQLLQKAGITKGSNLYNRMIERLMLAGTDDIHLFLSFISKLSEKMKSTKNLK